MEEHQKNIEDYEAYLKRLDIKEAAGKKLNEKDIAGLLNQMGKLAKSDEEKTTKMNKLYGGRRFKSIMEHIKEEYDLSFPEL